LGGGKLRSLADELRRREVSIAVCSPRELTRLFDLLRKLKLEDSVKVGTSGATVPREVLESGEPAALAAWLASLAGVGGRVTVGVDLGTRRIGLAVVGDGVLIFSRVLNSIDDVVRVVTALARLGIEVTVRVGCAGALIDLALTLAERLEGVCPRVELLRDERVKEGVIVGDFANLGKLSSHEIDALRIALVAKAEQ